MTWTTVGIVLMVLGVITLGRSIWLGFDPAPGWTRWRAVTLAAFGVGLLITGALLSAE